MYDGAWTVAVWAAGQERPAQEGVYVNRPSAQKLAREIDRIGEINVASVFGVAPGGVSLPGDGLREVIEDKSRKNLLKD